MSSAVPTLREGDAFPVGTEGERTPNVGEISVSSARPPVEMEAPSKGRVIPHVRIRPDEGRGPIDFREIGQYRDLLLTLTDRDIKVRYKQTILGVAWVVLQPLIASLIFAFVFGVVAGLSSNGRPYVLFAFAGLTAWNTFANVLSRASGSLVSNAHIVSKVYFPRMLLPLSAAASTLVDLAVSLGVMALIMAFYRVVPGWPILLLPVWIFVLLLMALGLGTMSGALMVRYRDIGYVVPVALQLGMYASPVAWATEAVPEQYRWFVQLNPLCGLIEAFRWSLLGQSTLHLHWLAYSIVTSILVFFLGAQVFKRLEQDFADVI